jgi:hypothetical protein
VDYFTSLYQGLSCPAPPSSKGPGDEVGARTPTSKEPTFSSAFPFGRKFPSRRKFGPFEGNLEGNSIWKEIAFGRKYCDKEGNEKEIYFIS